MAQDLELPAASGRGRPTGRRRATAYVRPKATPRRVVLVDRIADWTISIGGLAVIAAVLGIMVFLVQVVVPLFTGGRLEASTLHALPAAPGRVLDLLTDEYGSLLVRVDSSGTVEAFHAPTGRPLFRRSLDLGGQEPTAFARTLRSGDVAFGFADGSVRFGRIEVRSRTLEEEDLPPSLERLDERDRTDREALFSELPGAQYRRLVLETNVEPPEALSPSGAAILALDLRAGGSVERPTRAFAGVDAAGQIALAKSESRMNLLTRQLDTRSRRIVLPAVATDTRIARLLLTDLADEVYVLERGGMLQRFDVRQFDRPQLAESARLVPPGVEVTSAGLLIGEQSLVVGRSDGAVDVYFRVASPQARSSDGRTMVLAHALDPQPAAITTIAPSQRSKSFATGDASGGVWLRHSTSEQVLLELEAGGGPIERLEIAARDDAIAALASGDRAASWRIHVPHPETTLRTIFGKVWYEGYPAPDFTWQSSSGTDVFEPKFSLVPLVFGTLKATLYSLLFAIPVALLAAVYTSEFVHHRVRNAVKPVMEMMASLPSVVLGFVAALVLAPVVETWIASVLLVGLAVPLSLFAWAYLWQMLPHDLALRLEGLPKLGLMFVAVGLGVLAAWAFGSVFEAVFFGGDLHGWLDGRFGTGAPLLGMMLLPLTALAAARLGALVLGERFGALLRRLDRPQAGALDALRWLGILALAALTAFGGAHALAALGVDPRGSFVGTYVQRNTLVVGFAMGFAVIPIIYTIAEDAMNAVPDHLRAASLACGATPWQTAISVIVPTAMSGIFAAVMIGMGRAVGETMIVVMAAGNTPILDWNVFNGLRALSANIAVELPEAVKDGTLYRMLFLAALTLFAMTFVVNTLAELVRLRFRKRAAEL